jgi:hypothetical protein
VWLLTLLFGLTAGGLVTYYGVGHHDRNIYMTQPATRFDSPRVTDQPMDHAIDTLIDAGYRVVAVGHGKVILQEMGFVGGVLRVQGETGYRLRYCTARLPDCVPIKGPAFSP